MSYLPGIWASSTPSVPATNKYLTMTSGNQRTNDAFRTWTFSAVTGFGTPVSSPAGQNQGALNSNYLDYNGTAISTTGYFPQSGANSFLVYSTTTNGYGTKYSNPSTWDTSFTTSFPANLGNQMTRFNRAGNVLAAINLRTTGENTKAWAWSNSTGAGTKFSAVSNDGGSLATNISFGSDDLTVWRTGGVSGSSTPTFMSMRIWSNTTGWGGQYSNVSQSTNFTNWSDIRPTNANGQAVAATYFQSGGLNSFAVWPWSNSTGYGTIQRPVNTGGWSTPDSRYLQWSQTGNELVFNTGGSNSTTRAFYFFPYTTSIGTASANWVSPPWTNQYMGYGRWGFNNTVFAIPGQGGSPFIWAWPVAAPFVGTRFANPTTGLWDSVGQSPSPGVIFWEK